MPSGPAIRTSLTTSRKSAKLIRMTAGTLYVDFDDCLCETAREFTVILEQHFGRHVPYEAIASFNLGESFDLTAPQLDDLMRLGHATDVLARLEPVPGAIAALTTWRARGYAICVVTGRPTSAEAVSRAWLSQHQVPYDEILFVDKFNRRLDPPGAPAALSLEAFSQRHFALAIEDAPVMIDTLVNRMTMPVAVLDRPWNRRYATALAPPFPRTARRFHDWAAILAAYPRP